MPKLSVRQGGALREIKRLRLLQLGSLRDIRVLKQLNGGTLRIVGQFAPALSVSASPSSVSGATSSFSGPPQGVVTNSTTATPAGGVAPYTYAWTITGQGSPGALSPNAAKTAFVATVPCGETYSNTATVTVTDAIGQTATDTVAAQFTHADLT